MSTHRISSFFRVLIFFASLENGRMALSMQVTLSIPRYVDIGDTVKMGCDYEVANTSGRVVRWLHDGVEVFRISHQLRMHKLFEKRTMSTIDAIHIDPINSNDVQMVLVAVHPLLSGNYRCELRYNNGSMIYGEGELLVAEYSTLPPILKAQFSNESVSATCVAEPSLPGSNISWILNNKTIYTAIQYIESADGKYYSKSILNGNKALLGTVPNIRIQCIAYIGDLWSASSIIIDEALEKEKMIVCKSTPPTVLLNNGIAPSFGFLKCFVQIIIALLSISPRTFKHCDFE